ncbi:hypothetical protein NQ315_001221 [Exocentrus adspersus]|uniref:Uncharacterized protein n=1 Tax=Exocentrus adspersus TaxID=1586481 RepID=A0AAV8WFX6_9CUCU|nr:hypothetical protein NQ315_001221 [Exocentrus adspersus]
MDEFTCTKSTEAIRSEGAAPGATACALRTWGARPPSPVLDGPDQNGAVSSYIVSLLGAPGVGKTALISQFMTSECINAYDRQKDILGAQTVSIMLNGEESELTFQNTSSTKDVDKMHPPDAFVVLYSVVDKASFLKAEAELNWLQDADLLRSRPAILVGNKIDLARSRAVSTQDGKCLACTFRAKFTEISVGINHNVDELLVGILTQIRLKVLHFEEGGNSQQWYKSRGDGEGQHEGEADVHLAVRQGGFQV